MPSNDAGVVLGSKNSDSILMGLISTMGVRYFRLTRTDV
jgi:hypothetical protein